MTILEVFIAIYSELLFPEAIPYALTALAFSAFSWFWHRPLHSPKQRQAIHIAMLLWLLNPITALIGAMFHFSGPTASRGVTFNESASFAVGTLLLLCTILGIVLISIARGARINVVAAIVPVLFVQFWVSLISGCAIAGLCI